MRALEAIANAILAVQQSWPACLSFTRPDMKRIVHVIALLSPGGLVACATARPEDVGALGAVVPEPPERSVFIRASFDDDPSDYIGRCLPNGLAAGRIDETAARAGGRCRRHLTHRVLNASGTYEQTFNASSGVQGSLGVKPFGQITAGTTADAGLLVQYEITRKMVVSVGDADALAQCCEAAPHECGDQMIGEFWFGTGTISQFAGKATEIAAGGEKGVVKADLTIKDGWGWKRVTTFKDAYFAFRLQAGPSTSPARTCSRRASSMSSGRCSPLAGSGPTAASSSRSSSRRRWWTSTAPPPPSRRATPSA